MAVTLQSNELEDEEYIDMEVSSFSSFFCNSMCSQQNPREFEFQMSSATIEKEPTTSPADELFYKGKLLPLHLPPRLQMVEKLLQNSMKDSFEEFYSTPLATTTFTTPTSTSTPFESCNISPSESCRVSRELNPAQYLFEYSTDASGCINGENAKKSWTKKLKLIKQSSIIGSKLKASRAYLRSLFGKSGCSDESCAAAASKVADEGSVSKPKERFDGTMKSTKFGKIIQDKHEISVAVMKSFDKETITTSRDNANNRHRRSFSFAIKRHTTNKSSSASSSSSSGSSSSSSLNASNDYQYLQFLKRSSSVSAEIESPIQGAIAHCKQSQQLIRSRKTVSEVGFYSFSASDIAARDDQERPDLCRG